MIVRARTVVDEDLLLNSIQGKQHQHIKDNQESVFFVDSGSSSLQLFLELFGKEKRVGVQVFTCSTVLDTIKKVGDSPFFFDINPNYYTTTIDIIQNCLTQIDILILTHLFGIPNPDYVQIKELCKKEGVVLIDDLSQTFHAKVGGQYLEDLSNNYFYSFFYDKPISSISGGMLKVASEYKERLSCKYATLVPTSNYRGKKRLKSLYLMHKLLAPEIYTEEFRWGICWKYILSLWPLKGNISILNTILNSRVVKFMDRFFKKLVSKQIICRMSDVEISYLCSMMEQYCNNNQILINFLSSKNIPLPIYLKDDRITCSCAKRAVIQTKITSSQAQIGLYNWPSLICTEDEYVNYPNAVGVINSNVNVPCWTDLINNIDIKTV